LSSVRAFYIPPNTTALRLSLDYKGWALVLELLFGIVAVIALIGMVISCVFSEESVEPL
jgi:hypothetical protein